LGVPFARLLSFLARSSSAYAAIDAPFSVPRSLTDDPEGVWKRVLSLPLDGRPFARGRTLVETLAPELGPRGAKILRETERYWQGRGVSVRSTIWAGPRGGAPFAVACMTLLARHNGPIWPMRMNGRRGCVLLEAFPAAQLRQWGRPHSGYNGPDGPAISRRTSILSWLEQERGLRLSLEHRQACLSSADALDAVICVYAAAAVATDSLAVAANEHSNIEGSIAIHS
jgi:hypothetical protein